MGRLCLNKDFRFFLLKEIVDLYVDATVDVASVGELRVSFHVHSSLMRLQRE